MRAGGGLFLALYYAGPGFRRLFQFLLPFFLMFVLYESQGYFADLIRGQIRISEPYHFDKFFFGIQTFQGAVTPSQWWQSHTHPILDVSAGLAYLAYYPLFLVFALYFRFVLGRSGSGGLTPAQVRGLSPAIMWGMFWLALASFVTYLIFPAAPPWYVDLYGLGPAVIDAAPSAAGALRAEAWLGWPIFSAYWSQVPNVFGAIPSLHAAIPLLAAYFAFRFKSLRVAAAGYYFLMCFAAVYLNHHWVLDLIWGAVYGLAAAWAADRWFTSKIMGKTLTGPGVL